MFVGCLHRLNYSSVDLSILNSCAKVPGLCPATDTFFFFLFFFDSLRNRKFICQETSNALKIL